MRSISVLLATLSILSIGTAANATPLGGIQLFESAENASCRAGKAANSARADDGTPGRGAESAFVAQIAPGFYQQVAVAPLVGPGNTVGSSGCTESSPIPG